MPETVNGDTVSAMMMNPGKQTYRPQIRSFSIWALLVAVLIAVIVPGAQAALSENRIRAYHNFFADRTGLEPDLNAELHWVYGNFYDDFAPGSLVASKSTLRLGAGSAGIDDFVNKVVNSNMPHAAKRAAERAGFSSVKEAREALKAFGKKINDSGMIPSNAVPDTVRPDRIIVPGFGNNGAVVYQVRKGVLKLKTVLEWRP